MNPLDRLDSPMSPCRRTSARARMWTAENRPLYDRDKLRYPSDLTDAEWQHIGPLLPPAKRGGAAAGTALLPPAFLILCVAVAVRTIHLGDLSLWTDELFSRYYAELFGFQFLWTTGLGQEDTPPLY